jgi:catechol 2,3-dioxygenase-like lactoylglutathione lyase family enzyme
MAALDLRVSDVRPFIGAADFAVSKAFYQALGWHVEYEDANLALLANGGHRFYLQNAYAKEWVENTMLHVTVADAAAVCEQVRALIGTGGFGGARVAPPKLEDYGALVTYVWDPAGVLLHLAQWLDRGQAARA